MQKKVPVLLLLTRYSSRRNTVPYRNIPNCQFFFKKCELSKIISLILITFLIVGCKDNSVKPDPPEPVGYDTLMPLNIGNYWLYRSYEVESDGSGGTPSLWKLGFIIDDTLSQIIDGRRVLCYKLFICNEELNISADKPGTFKGSKLIYQNKEGLYYSGVEKFDSIKISFNDLIFPYSAVKENTTTGHIFYYSNTGNYYNIPDDETTQYTCVSEDSLITTPLGDYRCKVFKMSYMDYPPLFRDEVYYFIKPGLGIVAMVQMVYHYKLNQYSYIRKTLLTDYKIR